jgi:hypothetical protein
MTIKIVPASPHTYPGDDAMLDKALIAVSVAYKKLCDAERAYDEAGENLAAAIEAIENSRR